MTPFHMRGLNYALNIRRRAGHTQLELQSTEQNKAGSWSVLIVRVRRLDLFGIVNLSSMKGVVYRANVVPDTKANRVSSWRFGRLFTSW